MAAPSAGLLLLLALLLVGGGGAALIGPPRAGNQHALAATRFVCSAEELRGPPVMVHLTVSPLTKPRSREIEMNWRHTEDFQQLHNDTVVLTLGDPASSRARRLVSVQVSAHRRGKFRTKERFRHLELPHEEMENRCTEYWVGYFRGRQLLAKNCLKVLPAWMWQNREVLSPLSLDQLMIPGTHNSGTYKRTRDIVFKLVTTQDEDVWSQLMFGNRYLDMRIGYRPSERDPFWIYHDFFPVRPVNIMLKHVKWFMEFTKEVVILHFHRFPVGFDNSMVHTQFVQYLTVELGQWMAPRVYDVTMGELWASDKRLIISYNDWPMRRRNEYLWPSIPQVWGDKKSVSELYDFLKKEMRERSGGPQWAAMAELTPSPWDIIIPNRGLRDLAQKVNSEVTKWFRDEWWNTASIVATDFFLGNDIIDVAIEANLKRRRCVAGLVSHRRPGRRGKRRVASTPRHQENVSRRPAAKDWWDEDSWLNSAGTERGVQDSGRTPQSDLWVRKDSRLKAGPPDWRIQRSRLTAPVDLRALDSRLAASSGLTTQGSRPTAVAPWRIQQSRFTPQADWWTPQNSVPTPQTNWWSQGSPSLSGPSAWWAPGAFGPASPLQW